MAPSGVNDTMRQMMGASKRAFDRDHAGAWCTVGGTANVVTLTYTTAPTAYIQGQKFAWKATAANSGATTVNVNALGAKSVFKKSSAGAIACVGGEIQTGDLVELEYDGSQFQIMGGASFAETRTSSAAAVSAGVLDLSAIAAQFIQLSETGGGSITGLGAPGDGARRVLQFNGAAPGTLTASASLSMSPTSIPIQQGDTATFIWVGTVAVLVDYQRASGKALSGFILLGNTETGAVATGTTLMPFDDTIPQNTEGDQYMSLTVTPNNSSSTIIIDVLGFFGSAATQDFGMALFQDATAGALAVTAMRLPVGATISMGLRHKMTAGTTSATTFKVRAGGNNAGTNTFNGTGGGRIYGGVAASSITITEILP